MMLLALLLAAATPDPCAYDRAILQFGIEAFDQDQAGGWRSLAAKPGCEKKAADVIRYYRQHLDSRRHVLLWHEGQLRAEAGDYATAISLMGEARLPPDPAVADWNIYVDASIAFLRRDRAALAIARRRLMALPRPADWPAGDAWPMNGEVVDGLLRCFDRPYRDAYSQDCRH